ncbi:hypothetical protein C0216_30890 (plasmid) [Streptomyces globosus]|uniref:Uncharacterized protein n=1 Tax=Streptomyces globosus TaxID=68209 RepID=A0A344UAJ2_9ACTN|nr:hypothetical protein C0216_30890 [Streptomyces globosus]
MAELVELDGSGSGFPERRAPARSHQPRSERRRSPFGLEAGPVGVGPVVLVLLVGPAGAGFRGFLVSLTFLRRFTFDVGVGPAGAPGPGFRGFLVSRTFLRRFTFGAVPAAVVGLGFFVRLTFGLAVPAGVVVLGLGSLVRSSFGPLGVAVPAGAGFFFPLFLPLGTVVRTGVRCLRRLFSRRSDSAAIAAGRVTRPAPVRFGGPLTPGFLPPFLPLRPFEGAGEDGRLRPGFEPVPDEPGFVPVPVPGFVPDEPGFVPVPEPGFVPVPEPGFVPEPVPGLDPDELVFDPGPRPGFEPEDGVAPPPPPDLPEEPGVPVPFFGLGPLRIRSAARSRTAPERLPELFLVPVVGVFPPPTPGFPPPFVPEVSRAPLRPPPPPPRPPVPSEGVRPPEPPPGALLGVLDPEATGDLEPLGERNVLGAEFFPEFVRPPPPPDVRVLRPNSGPGCKRLFWRAASNPMATLSAAACCLSAMARWCSWRAFR